MIRDFFNRLFGSSSASAPEINPATGLPMIDGMASVDIDGNPYGTNLSDADSSDVMGPDATPDVNPANGLPMIAGSGIDVAGNPYGTDDTFSSGFDSSGFDSSDW